MTAPSDGGAAPPGEMQGGRDAAGEPHVADDDEGGALGTIRRLRSAMGDDGDASHYLGEAEKCFGAGAAVAAMAMCWNAMMSILYKKIAEYGVDDFAALAARSEIRPEGRVSSERDLGKYEDHDIITMCGEIGLFDRWAVGALQAHRAVLNSWARESRMRPSMRDAAIFINYIYMYARPASGAAIAADDRMVDRLLSLDPGRARAEMQSMPPLLARSLARKLGECVAAEAAPHPAIRDRLELAGACIGECGSDDDRAGLLRALSEGLLRGARARSW